jgi:hypothetical protein
MRAGVSQWTASQSPSCQVAAPSASLPWRPSMPQKRSAATRPVAATVRGLAGREDTTDVALPNRSSERDTSLTLTTSTPTYIRFLSPGMRVRLVQAGCRGSRRFQTCKCFNGYELRLTCCRQERDILVSDRFNAEGRTGYRGARRCQACQGYQMVPRVPDSAKDRRYQGDRQC